MSNDFELRLIRVRWRDKNQFAEISKQAQNPVVIKELSYNHFAAEIPSYPKIGGYITCQFALQCKSVLALKTPKVKRGEDIIDLFQISDSKYGKWWIEKGSWKERGKYKYHDAPSCRHAGGYTIFIDDITLHLNITPSAFTPFEYQELLSSFKGELWQLILDKESTTTITKDGKGKLPGVEFQKQVSKFIKFADQILAKPTEELREKQELQRIEKVRPIARTFMELSRRGSSVKFVTGRGFEPSYNNPENKYIADIVSRLVLIVRNLWNGVEYSKKSLDKRVDFIKKQLSQAIQNDFIQVDPEKLEAEIEQEERNQKNWEDRKCNLEKYFSQQTTNDSDNYKECIRFTSDSVPDVDNYNPDYITVWYNAELPNNTKVRCALKFPHAPCGINFFTKDTKYSISNVYYTRKVSENKNGKLYIGTIKKLSSLKVTGNDPHEKVLTILKKEYERYSKNNWQKQLTLQEKKEKEIELLGVQKRKNMYSRMVCKYEEKLASLQSIHKDLLRLSKKCKSLKITVENRLDYPGTMTFVQNPSYRGAYSSYKEIQNEAKFETLFDDLLIIQEYGITDQPNIYEKWCLLQIINTLESYGFIQNNGWETQLVNLVSKKNDATCSFLFTHSSLNQKVELIYQPILENRNKPDFMLKIKSKTGETVLVLDAKDKDYAEASGQYNTFSDDLDNLVNKKDYSATGNNAVFILHPKKDKGFLPVLATPQRWSSCTTLGGSSVFEWEDINSGSPEHMYGGAQVRPENLDNLKMVIALSLQYLTEDNHKVYTNVLPKNLIFCIVCGSVEFDKTQRCGTQGMHYTCKTCQHFFVKHFCGCGNRIWKHGSYWTYHDTRSTEPYNIKCPRCNGFYV